VLALVERERMVSFGEARCALQSSGSEPMQYVHEVNER
jgi:hypothetical protein